MEEDEAGTHEEIIGEKYTVCSRCGRPVPRRETKLTRQSESEETRSDQEELCAKCRKEMERSGEWDS